MAVFAVAASVVAVVGFAGLAVTQSMRVSDTRSRIEDIRSAFDFARQPGASMVQVDSSSSDTESLTEISHPGTERFFLVGSDVPMPPEGTVYRVWLLSGTQATWATDFVPEPGMMVVHARVRPEPVRPDPDLGGTSRVDAGSAEFSPFCRVCRIDGRLVAAVRFTPIRIGGRDGALLLGPLAVDPAFANQGHGRGLVGDALDAARTAGISLVLLVGDEPYYANWDWPRSARPDHNARPGRSGAVAGGGAGVRSVTDLCGSRRRRSRCAHRSERCVTTLARLSEFGRRL